MLILHTKVEKHYRHFKNIKGNLDEEIYYVFYVIDSKKYYVIL